VTALGALYQLHHNHCIDNIQDMTIMFTRAHLALVLLLTIMTVDSLYTDKMHGISDTHKLLKPHISWNQTLDMVTSYGVASQDRIYLIPQGQHHIVSVHRDNGTIDWAWPIPMHLCRTLSQGMNGIRCLLSDRLEFSEKSSVVVGGIVPVGRPGHVILFGLHESDGSLVWSQVLQNNGPTFTFSIVGDVVAMTSYLGGSVTGVSLTHGNVMWTSVTPTCDREASLASEHSLSVFIYSCQSQSTVISPRDGKNVQTIRMSNMWMYSDTVQIFYTVVDGTLYAISFVDNKVLWKKNVDIMSDFRLLGIGKSGELIAAFRTQRDNSFMYTMTSYLPSGASHWTLSPFTMTHGSSFAQKFHRHSDEFFWVHNDRVIQISVVDGTTTRSIGLGGNTFIQHQDEDDVIVTSNEIAERETIEVRHALWVFNLGFGLGAFA